MRFGRFKDRERNNNAERNNDVKKSRSIRDLTRRTEVFVGGSVRKKREGGLARPFTHLNSRARRVAPVMATS